MKIFRVALMVVAVVLLGTRAPVVCASATETDERIEITAMKSYVFKTYLKDDTIIIQSRDGAVTLTGIVSEEIHRALAQETLTGMPGVKSVDNRLEIKGAAPTANSDAWLRDKVKGVLLFHRSVSAGTTEVDVKDGIVTLRGEAASQAQKESTTEYTRNVEGVIDVINKMIVTKPSEMTQTAGEQIDDASITAQVKMTLLYHRSTGSITKVETNNGIVTLYGNAKKPAELNLATKFVRDVHGVQAVVNNMTIDQ